MTISKGLIKGAALCTSTVPSAFHDADRCGTRCGVAAGATTSGTASGGAWCCRRARPSEPGRAGTLKEAARHEGHALGLQQGKAEAEKALHSKLDELNRLMACVAQAVHTHCQRQEDQLVDFAFIATNRVLGDALQDRKMVVASVKADVAGEPALAGGDPRASSPRPRSREPGAQPGRRPES